MTRLDVIARFATRPSGLGDVSAGDVGADVGLRLVDVDRELAGLELVEGDGDLGLRAPILDVRERMDDVADIRARAGMDVSRLWIGRRILELYRHGHHPVAGLERRGPRLPGAALLGEVDRDRLAPGGFRRRGRLLGRFLLVVSPQPAAGSASAARASRAAIQFLLVMAKPPRRLPRTSRTGRVRIASVG